MRLSHEALSSTHYVDGLGHVPKSRAKQFGARVSVEVQCSIRLEKVKGVLTD